MCLWNFDRQQHRPFEFAPNRSSLCSLADCAVHVSMQTCVGAMSLHGDVCIPLTFDLTVQHFVVSLFVSPADLRVKQFPVFKHLLLLHLLLKMKYKYYKYRIENVTQINPCHPKRQSRRKKRVRACEEGKSCRSNVATSSFWELRWVGKFELRHSYTIAKLMAPNLFHFWHHVLWSPLPS